MKKNKLYFQIGLAIILTLLCVIFSGSTMFFLYKNNSGTAGVFATLIGIPLTICIALWTFIFSRFQKDTLIERYLNDEHFVGRDIEYAKLLDLIQNAQDRIIYISGNFGMGKTLFLKMSCDRINYTDKKNGSHMLLFTQ